MSSSAVPLPHDFDLDLLADADGASALVTGGAGFIGSRLCDLLAAAGLVVHAAGRRPRGPASAEHYWQVDLVDVNATHDLVRSVRPDFVFHLAANADNGADWDELLGPNVIGVYDAFEAARRAGVRRFVYASSNHALGMAMWDDDRFGDTAHAVEVGTDGAVRPDSLYGATKAWGEALGRLSGSRINQRPKALSDRGEHR